MSRLAVGPLLTFVVVAVALLGLGSLEGATARRRRMFVAFLLLACVPYCIRLAGVITDNLASPPEWDFMGFWLHARSAVSGLNFYDPHSAAALASAFDFSEEFRREIVATGFWYPPPTMLLFAPLGWFTPSHAIALWYAFHLTVTGACVVLLQRTFLPRGGIAAVLACALLVLASHGTLTTFGFAQTNLLALMCMLMFWQRRDSVAGGSWLAAAVVIKPFLLVLAIAPLLRGRWRAIGGMIGTAAALTLAAIAAFGPRTFAGYIGMNQVASKPDWIYTESATQSLLSLVLRLSHAPCSGAACLMNPVFLVAAAVIGAITLAITLRLHETAQEWGLALILVTGLLLYPLTGFSYSVLMLPALFMIWRFRARVPGGAWSTAMLIAAIYALGEWREGTETVWAFAAAWLALATIGVGLLGPRGNSTRAATAP